MEILILVLTRTILLIITLVLTNLTIEARITENVDLQQYVLYLLIPAVNLSIQDQSY